ncbi:hypothetical protein BLA60_21660 [Actinophytocola xinjiangensis]|uniref:Excreted virulence factor EspC (Type VII ESX diderm) n=1 Tax=Actinophytocola xinjiangensis TaxID=485602 RepID=A0A7Z1AXH7_9PSEU|nr:type VII secretion target [Actinophytocola xinjiangensis]OLF09180.1 hypothetical protein BLA60_21660 [Actinophytocola xinjiangensis]
MRDFSVDPDELVVAADHANTVSDAFTHLVWKDERIGDWWSEATDQPSDEHLATAIATYRASLRAATLRLAAQAEHLGAGLRASATDYLHADTPLTPHPDPSDD